MRLGVAGAVMAACLVGAAGLAADVTAERSRQEAIKRYRTGQKFMQLERWKEAEGEFRAAVDLDPLLEPAHYELGQVYMLTKQYPEAIKAYRACRQAFHENVKLQLADGLEGDRRIRDQIQALEETLHIYETGRRTAGGVGGSDRVARAQERIRDQINSLETRKNRSQGQASPTPPGVSIALGSAYFRNGDVADAEREYRAALDVDPSLGEAHNNLAVVYMLTNRVDEAERSVARAEKAGFKVPAGLKEDIQRRKKSH